MKLIKALVIPLFLLVSTGNSLNAQAGSGTSPKLLAGIQTGYNAGFGINLNLMLKDFALEFPFDIRIGAGYSLFNPGNAADARRIFINNATNGVPEKKGSAFDYRLDFLLPRSVFKVSNSYLVIGPRYSTFKGNFKFIGGNEDFDVVSKQWGFGIGAENHFKMTEKLGIFLAYGLDYYFPNTLTGHDTSYSPDNDNVNPRNDNQNNDIPFVYKDADRAISQPKYLPRIMIGVNFEL